MATDKKLATSTDLMLEKGLPANLDAERFVLGSALLDGSRFESVVALLEPEDFSLESNRRIFSRMKDLYDRKEKIDRVTMTEELMKQGQLESVGGFTYLSSLDHGLPEIVNLDSYVRIVKKKSDLRSIIFSGQRMIDMALMEAGTPQEIAQTAANSLASVQTGQSSEDGTRTTQDIIENYPGGISAFLDPTQRKRGLSTGFTKFDEMTAGLKGGELIILAARPSMGKTALLLNIAEHMSLIQQRFMAIFSLEMTADTLITRLICSRARISQQKFRLGFLNADERSALRRALFDLTESRLQVCDKFGITLPEIVKYIRRMVKNDGLHCVGIDYLQLIGTKSRGENRNLEVAAMTRELKMLAGECEIPIILISQLSRASEKRPGDHKPIISDLRDSGSIEQDADMVAFVHREEVYKRDREDVKGQAELILAKQRNGPIGTVKLRFLGPFTRFENRADDLLDDLPENHE